MRLEADEWKSTDRGGRPPMRACRTLAEGLILGAPWKPQASDTRAR
jgi:hypothetical protein